MGKKTRIWDWDEYTCAFSAANGGHFEILKWAYENGCPCDTPWQIGKTKEIKEWLKIIKYSK